MTLARRGRAALVAALLLALALVAACGSSGGPGTGGAERSAALHPTGKSSTCRALGVASPAPAELPS